MHKKGAIKFFLRESIKKEHNQHSSVLKVLRELAYYLNITGPLKTSLIFIFLIMKSLMIIKNPVVKIQNLIVNHKSRPIKSNPANS